MTQYVTTFNAIAKEQWTEKEQTNLKRSDYPREWPRIPPTDRVHLGGIDLYIEKPIDRPNGYFTGYFIPDLIIRK